MVPALRSANVLLPDGIRPATVVLDGARIGAVLDGDADVEGVLDLGQRLVAPAWVNAHTHLPMSSLRTIGGSAAHEGNVVEDLWFAIEERLTAADIRAFTRMGALECLLNGTGAVYEHYYAADAVADALLDVGLCGMVAPTLQDRHGPGAKVWEEQLRATDRLHRRDDLREAGVVMALGPHATDTVSDDLWRRLLELPTELPVHVHVAQSPEEHARAAERGATPVELLESNGVLERSVLLVHALYVSEQDRRRLDPARHLLGHCPWSQTQFAFPAPVRLWRDEGFGVAVGTDAGACNDSMNVQQELRALACGGMYAVTERAATQPRDAAMLAADRLEVWSHHRHMTEPRWLLDTITQVPGALHPGLPVGALRPGHRANLAVWDLRHPAFWPATEPLRALAFGDAAMGLHTVIQSGRIVGEVGRPSAFLERSEVQDWTREASERLASLLRRVGH